MGATTSQGTHRDMKKGCNLFNRSLEIQYCVYATLLSPQLKTSECHSKWGGWNRLTNQNPPLSISVPSPPPLTCYCHGIRGLKLSPLYTVYSMYTTVYTVRSNGRRLCEPVLRSRIIFMRVRLRGKLLMRLRLQSYYIVCNCCKRE
jgi:hypothetical protein